MNLSRWKFFRFFKNVWTFRKQLSNFQWWDYHYALEMLQKSIEIMAKNFETKGNEVDSVRLKKVQKMKRACELLNNFLETNHLERVQKIYGEFSPIEWSDFPDVPHTKMMGKATDNDRKIIEECQKLEDQEWEELWTIMKGQNYKKFKSKDWSKWFDGSGMLGWWD